MSVDPAGRPERATLYGRDHGTYGALHVARGAGWAAAISAGAHADSPSTGFKADRGRPNEDAALVLDDGRRCLLAVADSHFGHRASHGLVERLAALERLPDDIRAVVRWLDEGTRWPASAEDRSASTLCVTLHDRETGRGQGFSIGDSTAAVAAPGRAPTRLNRATAAYVHLGRSGRIGRRGELFDFEAGAGALVLCFTDGVDECHYRRPETSLRPHHLAAIFDGVGPDPAAYVEAVARAALAGVDGHPGGQDNIAIAAARGSYGPAEGS